MPQSTSTIKWPEIFSLGFLSVSIAISWIAYHEYQPHLLHNFDLEYLADFLVIAKAIILVITPPLAGLLADYLLRKRSNYFMVFAIGISSTAMIFMVVASIIGAGTLGTLSGWLPIMIVLWLVSMNLFVSPAYSMIDAFAPQHRLPVVVGFLFLTTELVYALEPVVVQLVLFFGDTLTFVVGGVLIAVSGYVFHAVSSKRVKEYKSKATRKQSQSNFIPILMMALVLGISKATLVEYIPDHISFLNWTGEIYSLVLLALSAIITFALSLLIHKINYWPSFLIASVLTITGVLSITLTSMAGGAILLAIGFSLINLIGLPFAIANLSPRSMAAGVGVFIGVSEIFTGLLEVLFQ